MIVRNPHGFEKIEDLVGTKQTMSRGNFYDLDKIKQIPIMDVCRNMLGLECVQRSGRTWCKARQERTASTLLHLDSNTFHDFGSNTHGDVIGLVSHSLGIDRKTAIEQLANAYHIEPENLRKDRDPNELTLWEYEQIGIAGDKATKNFDFDIERMPIERIQEISDKYWISMQDLRKQHPGTYEKILRQKALPFVRSLRNEYYLDLWSRYKTMCSIGNPDLFFHADQHRHFDDQIQHLKTAERLLSRAVNGTSIRLRPTRDYDPAQDLDLLSKGEIKPVMGTAGYDELQNASKSNDSPVKYRTVDYDLYVRHMMNDTEDLFYSASLKAGRVIIGYLEKDMDQFKPYFDKMRPQQSQAQSKPYPAPAKSRPDPERGERSDLTMRITSENCGDVLCLYHTGKRIRILEVDSRTITYEQENGQKYGTFEDSANAIVERDPARIALFDKNCKLGRALDAAETKALKILLGGPGIPVAEVKEADETLYSVRKQMKHLDQRMAEERAAELPGKDLAAQFLSNLYEQGTGSHDTFFGHRVENVSQMAGLFSIDGQPFDYTAANEHLSQVRYKKKLKGLDAQISAATHRKNHDQTSAGDQFAHER